MLAYLTMKKIVEVTVLILLWCNLIGFNNALANEKKVFYAGFSFSGNYIDKSSSIQFTNQLINEKDENGIDVISKSLIKTIKKVKAKNFNIDFDFADLEKGLDHYARTTFVLDNENYYTSTELSKTYMNNIQMFFQIIFYNFKTKKLITSIPYDVSVRFFTKNEPTEKEITNYNVVKGFLNLVTFVIFISPI